MNTILLPIEKRYKILIVLLSVFLVISILNLIAASIWLTTYRNFETAYDGDYEKLELLSELVTIINLVRFLLYIVVIVVFLMWMRRTYNNLNLIHKTRVSDGWTVGYWFIPVLNLFKPFQLMLEIFVKTSDYIKQHDTRFRIPKFKGLLVIWWVLWVFYGFVVNIGLFFYIGKMGVVFPILVFKNVILIGLVIAVILMVIQYHMMARHLVFLNRNTEGSDNDDLTAHLTSTDPV